MEKKQTNKTQTQELNLIITKIRVLSVSFQSFSKPRFSFPSFTPGVAHGLSHPGQQFGISEAAPAL